MVEEKETVFLEGTEVEEFDEAKAELNEATFVLGIDLAGEGKGDEE